MDSNLSFVTATVNQIPQLLEMMQDFCFIDSYPFVQESRIKNLQEFINNDNLGRIWTINYNSNIIGYIVLAFGYSFEYNGRDAFIDEFFIIKEYRNKGIGNKTLEFIEQQAKELNINAIHLEVESLNVSGYNLYRKNNYNGNNRALLTKYIS